MIVRRIGASTLAILALCLAVGTFNTLTQTAKIVPLEHSVDRVSFIAAMTLFAIALGMVAVNRMIHYDFTYRAALCIVVGGTILSILLHFAVQ